MFYLRIYDFCGICSLQGKSESKGNKQAALLAVTRLHGLGLERVPQPAFILLYGGSILHAQDPRCRRRACTRH